MASPLNDEKYPNDDLFICDVSDAALKDIIPQLEHPFFSLSKKPDKKIREYEHNGNTIKVMPGAYGLATIYDKDILIYAISQIMAALNRNEKGSRRVEINCHELLMFINRGTSGRDYEGVVAAIERLAGTRISTNIKTGNEEQYNNFGLIDSGSVHRKNGADGRLLSVEIVISEWVYKALESHEVLTLHRDYFRLRKPIDRRLYELARKHCGQKQEFSISTGVLWVKSGSQSTEYEFRRTLKSTCESDHLPDYKTVFDPATDMVTFYLREKWWKDNREVKPDAGFPKLLNEERTTKKALAYIGANESIELRMQEWVNFWIDSGCPYLANPDAAFIGFCRTKYQKGHKQAKLFATND